MSKAVAPARLLTDIQNLWNDDGFQSCWQRVARACATGG